MAADAGRARPAALERQAGGAVVAHGVGLALRFVAVALSTSILGPDGYGSFVLATTLLTVLHKFGLLGLSPGLLPYVANAADGPTPGADLRALLKSACRPVVALGLALGLALALFGPTLGAWAFDDPRAGWMLRGLSALVVLDATTAIVLAVVQGLLGVRTQAWVEKVVVPATIVLALVAARALGLGAEGVVGATVVGSAVGLAIAIPLLLRRLPANEGAATASPTSRALLAASWPLLGTGVVAFVLGWMDVLVLGVLRESAEVGIYGLAARLSILTLAFHDALGPFFLAHATRRAEAGDTQGLAALYRRTAVWSSWTSLGPAIGLAIWADELLALFGDGFASGATALRVLLVARLAVSLTGMSGKALIALRRTRLNLIDMGALIVINAALDLWWIPEHGAVGAAAATAVAWVAVDLAQIVQVHRLARMWPFERASAGPLFAAATLGPLAWWQRDGVGGVASWISTAALFGLGWLALAGAVELRRRGDSL